MGTRFVDHSPDIKRQMSTNIVAALTAMGIEAVRLIIEKMRSGYTIPHPTYDESGKPTGGSHTDIRHLGSLMRDVSFEVEGDHVIVGNSLEYAVFIHEGTRNLTGRPYIKDAIMQGMDHLQQVAAEQLKHGFS